MGHGVASAIAAAAQRGGQESGGGGDDDADADEGEDEGEGEGDGSDAAAAEAGAAEAAAEADAVRASGSVEELVGRWGEAEWLVAQAAAATLIRHPAIHTDAHPRGRAQRQGFTARRLLRRRG
jgi:hypothetical protein